MAWPDLAWPDLAWPDLAWPDLTWPTEHYVVLPRDIGVSAAGLVVVVVVFVVFVVEHAAPVGQTRRRAEMPAG